MIDNCNIHLNDRYTDFLNLKTDLFQCFLHWFSEVVHEQRHARNWIYHLLFYADKKTELWNIFLLSYPHWVYKQLNTVQV